MKTLTLLAMVIIMAVLLTILAGCRDTCTWPMF